MNAWMGMQRVIFMWISGRVWGCVHDVIARGDQVGMRSV